MVAAPNSLPPDEGRVQFLRPEFRELIDFNIARIHNFLHDERRLPGSENLRLDPGPDWSEKNRTVPADEASLFLLEKQLVALGADINTPVLKEDDPRGELGPVTRTVFEVRVPTSTVDPTPRDRAWLEVNEFTFVAEGEKRTGRLSLKILATNPLEQPKPKQTQIPTVTMVIERAVVRPSQTRFERSWHNIFGWLLKEAPRRPRLP